MPTALFVMLLLGALYLFAPWAFGWLIVGTLIVTAIVRYSLDTLHDIRKDRARSKLDSLIERHLETLARRRLALVRNDPYGVPELDSWQRECERFLDRVVFPQLTQGQLSALKIHGVKHIIEQIIDRKVLPESNKISQSIGYDDNMSPIDYEILCSALLSRAGWLCELTKASGDQGVDIIAKQGKCVLAVQCKKYSSPVGNGAVQEVVAAKAHIGATFGVVVTNNTFTRSARELAKTTRTLLLHHSEISLLSIPNADTTASSRW